MKKDKKMNNETLGGRLKGYEAQYESSIEPEKHIIIRIDGHHFSKYTKGLKRPYDEILSRAMIETTKDLVERFDAYTGYTQSDEISLFLPSLKDVTVDNRKKKTHKLHKRVRDDWTHSFGGRVQKMASLVAAFTTMSFNKHFKNELGKFQSEQGSNLSYDKDLGKYSRTVFDKVGNAYFDARVYGVPDQDEVFNSFMWRVRDAEKNSRSMFAQAYCSHKELHGLTGQEQVQYCKDKTGNNWELVDDVYKYGVFVKKELYWKDMGELTNGQVQRSRIVEFSTKMTTYNDDDVKLIMGQYK